jgi:hypothetical protein
LADRSAKLIKEKEFMGRGEAQEGFEFERSSLEPHSRALKNALTLAIEKAIPLTLRASKPQLAAWILSSLIPGDGLLIEAKEFLTDIASGELLTSGDIDLIHDLGERIDEWKYQAGEPETLEEASSILFHSASHLALKAATLPTSSPMAKKASAQAIRSALYALAFSNPEKMEETLDRLDAGLLLAELGESGKTLYSEDDVPYQALSWLHWERDVEMAIEDGLITEIDLFLSQVARLRDRNPSLALSLTSLCALDAQGLVIKEDWRSFSILFLLMLLKEAIISGSLRTYWKCVSLH